MTDRLLRGTFPKSNLRFSVCQTESLCSLAAARLGADWVAGKLLGEALTCAALLSVNLKDNERLTLRWSYPGPVGMILADTNENGEVRGFPQNANPTHQASTPSAAIGGGGQISGTSSYPDRVGHQGTTPAVFQDISRDLAHFLSLSFQIETALGVGLVIQSAEPFSLASATGIMLQPLPGCDLEVFEQARRNLEHPAFREWMEAFPRTPEDLVEWVNLGEPPEWLGKTTPAYVCQCSREKVESILRMLDPVELRDMMEKDGRAEVNCHFCASTYLFSRADLQTILRQTLVGHG